MSKSKSITKRAIELAGRAASRQFRTVQSEWFAYRDGYQSGWLAGRKAAIKEMDDGKGKTGWLP